MRKVDVLCVGIAAYDLTLSLSHHPLPDDKTMADSLICCGGGPAANAAVTVARLGYTSAYAGYIGNDLYGDNIIKEFDSEGVVTDYVVRGDSPTSLSIVLVKPDGSRSIVHYRGLKERLLSGSVDFSSIEPAVILFDGHEPDISMPLVKEVRARGIKTILDAGSVHPGTKELIHHVDYLVCSEKFAYDFTGETDYKLAIEKLHEHSSSIIITLGEKGLIWKNKTGEGALPAFTVDVVDTTGAGDAFHGAFAACIAANKECDYSLNFSRAAAALCCTKMSARGGIPNKEEEIEFLYKMNIK